MNGPLTIGQRVMFGRASGEKTMGTIVNINGKSVKVAAGLARGGRPVGTEWRVAPAFVYPIDDAASPAPAPTVTAAPGWKVGDRVTFEARAGQVVTGTVARVNTKTVTVDRCDDGSRGWRVSPSMLRAAGASAAPPAATEVAPPAAPRRADDAIMGDIFRAYIDLSPENLSCDGERSRAQVATRRAAVNRRLAALQAEMGRRVSEDETWAWYDKGTAHRPQPTP